MARSALNTDRRDFLKTVGIVGFGLFLPRWTGGAWKQKPTVLFTPWDYELALYDSDGKEVSGLGYARVRGNMAKDFRRYIEGIGPWAKNLVIENHRTLNFAPAAGSGWGEINSLGILGKDGAPLIHSNFQVSQFVPSGVIVQFNPKDIEIYDPPKLCLG